MRRDQMGIAVTAAVAAGAVLAAVTGAAAAVAVFGLPLLAAPGYVWTEVLFAGRAGRLPSLLVGTGLALAVPVLGGLLLGVAGVPLHRTAWACLLAAVTVAGDLALLARGRAVPAAASPAGTPASRPPVRSRPVPAAWPGWRQWPHWRAAAGFATAGVIAAAAVGLAAAGAASQPYPGFTALWLVPAPGQAGRAWVGVSNHEGSPQRYRLVIRRRGHVTATWTLALGEGRTWRDSLHFPGRAAATADLYRLPDLRRPFRHVTSSRVAAQAPDAPGRTP